MTDCPRHRFDVSFADARAIQETLARLVCTAPRGREPVRLVGGVDAAFLTVRVAGPAAVEAPAARTPYRQKTVLAVAVVYDRERGEVVETARAAVPVLFPYVPGYLSFREGPAVLCALGALSRLPDAVIYDGCGIAHPRGLGIASHMAVVTGIPSVGCAKSLLCGECPEPGGGRGAWTALVLDGRVVGRCLRTRTGIRPVYVSPGSGYDVAGAADLVLSLADRYRLPEPTRRAHAAVSAWKRELTGALTPGAEGNSDDT